MFGDIPQSIVTLQTICGLKVTHNNSDSFDVYVFWHSDKIVRVAYNYVEAKTFAEGFAAGRDLTMEINQND